MSQQPSESPFKDMTRDELAAHTGFWAQPGSQTHAQLVATFQSRCTGDLVSALKSLENAQTESAKASGHLANRVFWLNVVLAAATVMATVIAYLTYLWH